MERNAIGYFGDYLGMAEIYDQKGFHHEVELLETAYKKSVTIGKKVFQTIADKLTRYPSLT